MPSPWYLNIASDVRHLDGHQFERLAWELLDYEVHRRHPEGTVNGPPPVYGRDAGMDIQVVLREPPRIPESRFAHALTPDIVDTICVCCETGDNWRKSVEADAGKPAPLDTLRSGGRVAFFIGHQLAAVAKAGLQRDLASVAAEKLDRPCDAVAEALRVVDANDIEGFLSYHPIWVEKDLGRVLRVPALAGMLSFQEWLSRQARLRGLPEFAPDAARDGHIQSLLGLLERDLTDSRPEVIWVTGPPGVGKTRLVSEALRRCDTGAARTYVAPEFEYGKRAINEHDLAARPEMVIVIDECPPDDVGGLAVVPT